MAQITRSTKENSGRNRLKRKGIRALTWVVLIFLAYMLLHRFFLAGFVDDIEIDEETGKTRVRKRPNEHIKVVNGKKMKKTPEDGVLEGYWHLLEIRIPEGGLQHKNPTTSEYINVEADFCVLEWARQKDNAANVPLFHDLKDKSSLCPSTTHTFDLYSLAKAAREYDAMANTTLNHLGRTVPPTSVIFHESRCGSTLIANLFASFSPSQAKVYSESKAPYQALNACMNPDSLSTDTFCSKELHDQLIQDVFYLMGRTNRPEDPQYVFYKMQADAIYSIEAFVRAMPNTPWIYLYRDPIEILVSHLINPRRDHDEDANNPLKGIITSYQPICLAGYGSPIEEQSTLFMEIVQSKSRTIESLTREEYCAAYLASLCEAAIRQYNNNNNNSTSLSATSSSNTNQNSLFINYNQLPQFTWEYLLTQFLGIKISSARVQNMEEMASIHSHGSGYKHKKQDFVDDSDMKHNKATNEIIEAANLFLKSKYEQLQRITHQQIHQ